MMHDFCQEPKTVDGRGGCKGESKRFPIISSRAQTAERRRGHRGGVRARANININEARIPFLCVILYHICPLLSAIRAQNLKWRSLSCASSVFISGAITGRTGSPISQAGWSWSRCETPRRYLNISAQCHAFHPWRYGVATVCLQPVKMTSLSSSLSSGYTFNKSQNIIDHKVHKGVTLLQTEGLDEILLINIIKYYIFYKI